MGDIQQRKNMFGGDRTQKQCCQGKYHWWIWQLRWEWLIFRIETWLETELFQAAKHRYQMDGFWMTRKRRYTSEFTEKRWSFLSRATPTRNIGWKSNHLMSDTAKWALFLQLEKLLFTKTPCRCFLISVKERLTDGLYGGIPLFMPLCLYVSRCAVESSR